VCKNIYWNLKHKDVIEEIDKYPVKYIQRVQNWISKLNDTENTVCLEFCVGTTRYYLCRKDGWRIKIAPKYYE